MSQENNSTAPTVVILSGQSDQATLAKGTSRAGFGVICVNNNRELSEALAKQPWGFVHNFRAFDSKQNYLMQQRLARTQSISSVARFIITPEINTPALALVADCGIRQAFNLSSALSGNLGEQLNVLKQTDNARSEAQKIVHSQRIIQTVSPTTDYLTAVQEAYQAYPHDPIVRLEYAISRLHTGHSNDAGLIAKRLLQVESHNVRAMNLLAKVQMLSGDLEGGFRILEVANKLCPSNPERLSLIGDFYMKKGDLNSAKKAYLEALDVFPPTQAAREGLVQMSLSADEVEVAVNLLRNVMPEKDRAALINKAAIQAVNQQHYSDALRIYGYALQHLEEEELKASIFYNQGLAYKKMGDLQAALLNFKECLRKAPTHPHVAAHISEIENKN